MRISPGIALCSLTAVAGAAGATLAAPADMTAHPPQVEAGQAAYAEHCAACHGDDLAGSDHAPGLKDDLFREAWQGKPARQLYSRIISTMPLTDPGSLEPKTVLDVTTFILAANRQPLPATGYAGADDLNGVTIAPPAE